MDIRIPQQALLLLEALGLGLLLGLGYDVLRPPRHSASRLGAAALDALFCLAALALTFCFAMSSGSGRLGTWELVFALLAFLIYMNGLSARFLAVYIPSLAWIGREAGRCKKIIKKSANSAKRVFQKMRECFIIKK